MPGVLLKGFEFIMVPSLHVLQSYYLLHVSYFYCSEPKFIKLTLEVGLPLISV